MGPAVCLYCGRPAVVPETEEDEDRGPLCGSMLCGLKAQAAQDYHDERGS